MKEIYWIFNTFCIIPVLFSTNDIYLMIISFSVQVIVTFL